MSFIIPFFFKRSIKIIIRSETSIYMGYKSIAKVNFSTANIFKLSANPVPNHAQKSSPSGRKYDFLIVGIMANESITKFVTRATTRVNGSKWGQSKWGE